jgi:hypothetical protein
MLKGREEGEAWYESKTYKAEIINAAEYLYKRRKTKLYILLKATKAINGIRMQNYNSSEGCRRNQPNK